MKAVISYSVANTVHELSVEAPFVSTQLFSDGQAMIMLRDEDYGMPTEVIQLRSVWVIRKTGISPAPVAQQDRAVPS